MVVLNTGLPLLAILWGDWLDDGSWDDGGSACGAGLVVRNSTDGGDFFFPTEIFFDGVLYTSSLAFLFRSSEILARVPSMT